MRDANKVAHALHTKRQHRHLAAKRPAPAPLWGPPASGRADLAAAPARTSVRGAMGFSSKKPAADDAKAAADAKPAGWG